MTTAIKRKADGLDSFPSDSKKPKADKSITSFFGQPKSIPGAQDPNASKPNVPPPKPFAKDAWIAKLSEEQKELLKLEIETLHDSWLPYLKDVLEGKDFLELKRFLKKEGESGKKIFPPLDDVYSWYVCSTTVL